MSDETTLSTPGSRSTGTHSSLPVDDRAVGKRSVPRPVSDRGWREVGDHEGSQARSSSALDQRLEGFDQLVRCLKKHLPRNAFDTLKAVLDEAYAARVKVPSADDTGGTFEQPDE